PVELDRARSGRGQGHQQGQDRGFTGSGFADDAEAAPGGDLQVDAVEHGSGADTAAEAFVDIAHGEHGYRGDGVDGAKGGWLGHGVPSSPAVGSPSVGRAVTDRADSTSLRA